MPLSVFPKCFLEMLGDGRMTVEQLIEQTGQLDLDGLELYWRFLPQKNGRADEAKLTHYRRLVERQGRRLPMLCYSPDFTRPTQAERDEEVRAQQNAIDAAVTLGASFCRVLSGQRRPGLSREDGIRWVSQCIQRCLPHAETRSIVLIMESHYKDGPWQYPEFAQKMDVFLEILQRVGPTPWLQVNFDPSNAVGAGHDPIEFLHAVKDRVATMHASERYLEGGTLDDLRKIEADPHTGYANILKHGAPGRGFIDYPGIFSILRQINFRGWISIEDGNDPVAGLKDIAESSVFLRRMMKQYGVG